MSKMAGLHADIPPQKGTAHNSNKNSCAHFWHTFWINPVLLKMGIFVHKSMILRMPVIPVHLAHYWYFSSIWNSDWWEVIASTINSEKYALRLQKAVYGLKVASKRWHDELWATLLEIGMNQSIIERCNLHRTTEGEITMLVYSHDRMNENNTVIHLLVLLYSWTLVFVFW